MLSGMEMFPSCYQPASLRAMHPQSSYIVPVSKVTSLPDSSKNAFHQWPWRAFAFASDLGIVAHLLKKPKWAGSGWLVSIPYYVSSIASRPNKAQKQDEAIYQLTANGLFPWFEAKLGLKMGNWIREKLTSKMPMHKGFQLALPWKAGSALLAMAVLTPTVGDRLSDKILEFSRR